MKYRDQLLDEMRHAGPMPDVPLVVLTAMDIDAFQKAVLIGESESLIHWRRPDAVLQAIQDLLGRLSR